jgi:hypothetical protein
MITMAIFGNFRIGATVAAAVLLSILSASTAVAAPADPPEPFAIDFSAGDVCAFPVSISGIDGQKSHTGPGIIAATGPLTATITNLAEPSKTLTLNIPGPTKQDGTIVGPWLIIQENATHPGDPFMILNKGRVTFKPDMTIDTRTGKRTDLCAELA